MLIGHHSN